MPLIVSKAMLATVLLLTAGTAIADYSGHPRAGELLATLKQQYGFGPDDLQTVRDALASADASHAV